MTQQAFCARCRSLPPPSAARAPAPLSADAAAAREQAALESPRSCPSESVPAPRVSSGPLRRGPLRLAGAQGRPSAPCCSVVLFWWGVGLNRDSAARLHLGAFRQSKTYSRIRSSETLWIRKVPQRTAQQPLFFPFSFWDGMGTMQTEPGPPVRTALPCPARWSRSAAAGRPIVRCPRSGGRGERASPHPFSCDPQARTTPLPPAPRAWT